VETSTGSVPTSDGDQPKKRRRMSGEVRAAVIAATATIVAALIAAVVAITTDSVDVTFNDGSSESDELRATATSLQGQVEELTTENEELTTELEELREEDRDRSRDPDPTTSTTSPPGSEVRRETGQTPYLLEYGKAFDLDSEPTDGDWGLSAGGSDVYLSIGSIERRLTTSGTSARMAIVDSPPSYETCASEVGLLYEGSLETEEVVSGRMLCYQSSEGRWAYVHIVDLDDEARVATFEIVVWKLPTDP
jgi:hypothetical protein